MIVFIVGALVLCLAAAKPNPGQGSYGVDGVGGPMYEFPEYEDPAMAILQMAGMGAMPLLTIMEMQKEGDSARQEDLADDDKVESLKKSLDKVIEGLKMARLDLEDGKTNISPDMGMFIHCLKSLERLLRDNKPSVEDTLLPSLPFRVVFHNGNDHSMDEELPSANQTTSATESTESVDSRSQRIKTPMGDVLISTETKKLPISAKSGKKTPIVLYSKRTVYKMKFAK